MRRLIGLYFLTAPTTEKLDTVLLTYLSSVCKHLYVVGHSSSQIIQSNNMTLFPCTDTRSVISSLQSHHDHDIFVASNSLLINGQNSVRILERNAYQASSPCISAGAITMTFPQHNILSEGIYSLGRNIVSRFGSFVSRTNLSFDAPLTLLRDTTTHCADAAAGVFAYIPREIYGSVDGFDGTLLLHSPTLMMDDFCLRARLRGYSTITTTATKATKIPPIKHIETTDRASDDICTYWLGKWHWDPRTPNLDAIRSRWAGTRIVNPITTDLNDHLNHREPWVDVLLVTRNSINALRNCVQSILANDYQNYKLYLLDNASSDSTGEFCDELAKVHPDRIFSTRLPVNIGVPAAMNWLATISSSPLVARFDDDIIIEKHTLQTLVNDILLDPFVGAVIPKIIIENGTNHTLQFAGHYGISSDDISRNTYKAKVCTAGGPLLLYRRKAMEKAGDFDISFSPSQIEDLDHAIRVWECGYDIVYDGTITVKHYIDSESKVTIQRVLCNFNQYKNMGIKHGEDWYHTIKPENHQVLEPGYGLGTSGQPCPHTGRTVL